MGPGGVVSIGNHNGLIETVGEQIGVTVIRTPFVSDAIDRGVLIADNETRFQPPFGNVRIAKIGCQFKVLHENRPGREIPFASRCKADLLIGSIRSAVVRNRKPSGLNSAI